MVSELRIKVGGATVEPTVSSKFVQSRAAEILTNWFKDISGQADFHGKTLLEIEWVSGQAKEVRQTVFNRERTIGENTTRG